MKKSTSLLIFVFLGLLATTAFLDSGGWWEPNTDFTNIRRFLGLER